MLVLPESTDTAARNMARDLALLENPAWPDAQPRLRCYGWSEAAFTFGYGQSWDEVAARIGWAHGTEALAQATRIRRASGGGVVDHRQDRTFAFVLPAGHAAAQLPATEIYRKVHFAVAVSLRALGQACALQACNRGCASGRAPAPGLCFVAPEPHDVIAPDGRKLAGAAMKRTRAGVLLQGSVDRQAAAAVTSWNAFAATLAEALGEEFASAPTPGDDLPWGALESWARLFASEPWNAYRRRNTFSPG